MSAESDTLFEDAGAPHDEHLWATVYWCEERMHARESTLAIRVLWTDLNFALKR
jgi:hypothetical protein